MTYDVIIVGGGLIGSGLALALRNTGLNIALIDARLPSNNDPRLFGLNSSSCQFLKNLALWSKLASFAAPIHKVHVSRQGHFGAVRLAKEDVHLTELGHVIPAYHIETALNNALLTLENVTLYRPAKLTHLKQNNGVELTIEINGDLKTLQADLVIGADGTESTVRKEIGISAEVYDYKQSALVTRTQLSRSHGNIAYERFLPQGAIAMLPLLENECATIWTADNEKVAQLMALSEEDFLSTLQSEFGYRLGRMQKTKQRHVYPLRMVRAECAAKKNVLLLGNAAHTLHPIAAQGFNLAIYEVAVLVEEINHLIEQKKPLSLLNLAEFSEKIEKQQASSMGVSNRLPHLFAKESSLLNAILQASMISFDVVLPLKKKFIQTMLGRSGSVPTLLLG